MKVAIIGADRQDGSVIVRSCECRGIQTVSVIEELAPVPGEGRVLIKSLKDLRAEDFEDVSTVIDPVSFAEDCALRPSRIPLLYLLELLRGTGRRLLILGSVGCLYADALRNKRVFEENFLEGAQGSSPAQRLHARLFKKLQSERDVMWTLLCPPLIREDAEHKTGHYEFSDDVLPMGADGSSVISNYDLADATAELLKRGLKPFSVVSVRSTLSLR